MSLGVLGLTLLSGACANSTQSAAKAQESRSPLDPANLASSATSSSATPAAQPANHTDQHVAEDKVPRTKPADAIKLVKESGAILVDVRDISSYENMHAKGAIHVSYQDIQEGKLDKLPKDKHLIFYCT